jgi:hypothetical protein
MARKPIMLMRKKNPITAIFTKYANLKTKVATPAGGKQGK